MYICVYMLGIRFSCLLISLSNTNDNNNDNSDDNNNDGNLLIDRTIQND